MGSRRTRSETEYPSCGGSSGRRRDGSAPIAEPGVPPRRRRLRAAAARNVLGQAAPGELGVRRRKTNPKPLPVVIAGDRLGRPLSRATGEAMLRRKEGDWAMQCSTLVLGLLFATA